MRTQEIQSDITVVGGGLAGVCASIAAARLGKSVALINNRPVLGGNSSSEVRVWVCGSTGHGSNHNAREGGIMGELFVENQFRNPDGNPYYWDLVVLEAVRAEPNIRVFLNTDVREVFATGPPDNRHVASVTGWTMGSEITSVFRSPLFLDCTGDGLVGHLAGADYRIGREGRDEYGESFAPEVADDLTLGSTLLFYTKDMGRPCKYVPPSFAKDITKTSIPERRIIKAGDNGCAYWWIEWGGEHDIVHDNEMIRDELWAAIYGIWDFIKNSGKFDADTMALEWVGALPGKREYRRFLGDHVLTQSDIMDQREFADRVAIGGWSIDLHPPRGHVRRRSRLEAPARQGHLPHPLPQPVLPQRRQPVARRPRHLREPCGVRLHEGDGNMRQHRRGRGDGRGALPRPRGLAASTLGCALRRACSHPAAPGRLDRRPRPGRPGRAGPARRRCRLVDAHPDPGRDA